MTDFRKIRPVGDELFHADVQTGRNDEVNSRFFEILRNRLRINEKATTSLDPVAMK